MKTKRLFAVAVLVLQFGFVRAQDFDGTPHVSVYGTAVTEVVPDEMIWQLSVTTRAAIVTEAAETHDRNLSALLALLKQRDIEERSIQTSRMQLSENWEYRNNSRIRSGYIASAIVTFKSDDLDQYRDLWVSLAELAGVSVNNVSFETSKRIEYQDATRLKALEAAKHKATVMAEALEVKIGRPILIEEEQGMDDVVQSGGMAMAEGAMMRMSADIGNQGPSMSPGTISIRVRVRTKFAIEQPMF